MLVECLNPVHYKTLSEKKNTSQNRTNLCYCFNVKYYLYERSSKKDHICGSKSRFFVFVVNRFIISLNKTCLLNFYIRTEVLAIVTRPNQKTT